MDLWMSWRTLGAKGPSIESTGRPILKVPKTDVFLIPMVFLVTIAVILACEALSAHTTRERFYALMRPEMGI